MINDEDIYMIYFCCLGHLMQDICLISPYTAFDLFFLTRLSVDTVILKRSFLYGCILFFINTPCGMNIDWTRSNLHTAT